MECEIPGNRPNKEGTKCVDKTLFPVIGPIFSVMALIILLTVIVVKRFKRETNLITSLIALIGCIETLSIMFNLWMTVYHSMWKYAAFAAISLTVLYILNLYNYWYIAKKVQAPDAQKVEKLSQKKVKDILLEILKKEKKNSGK